MRYLKDKSEAGVERWTVASRAFERYDKTRRFTDLNPNVQEMWLSITDAVLGVIYEAANGTKGRGKGQAFQQEHLAEKAG